MSNMSKPTALVDAVYPSPDRQKQASQEKGYNRTCVLLYPIYCFLQRLILGIACLATGREGVHNFSRVYGPLTVS